MTFRLDLPPHMHLHPVFHVSLLEPYTTSSIPGRLTSPPPPVEVSNGTEYEVATILDSKIVCNKLYYFVDWLGYTPNDRTWEPAENLDNASDNRSGPRPNRSVPTNPVLGFFSQSGRC